MKHYKLIVVTQIVLLCAVCMLAFGWYRQSQKIDTLERSLQPSQAWVDAHAKPAEPVSSEEDAPKRVRENRIAEKTSFRNRPQRPSPSQDLEPRPDEPAEVFEERVRAAVAAEVDQRDEERWQKRLDRRSQRTKERIAEFSQSAGISAASQVRLEELLLSEQTEVSEIFREARESLNFPEARTKAETVRKETDEEVRSELDDDEFAEYEKMRQEEVERFRGRRGPRN